MYTKTNLRNFKQDTKSSNNSIQKNKKIHKLKHFLKETKKTTIMYNKQSKLI